LFVLATEGDVEAEFIADHVFFVPPAPELVLPLLEVVPLQLFAYHIAVVNGCDVDHPRNLVKSVVRE
jgi:glucosamine--fructose-6-phosphate aminotransferase (isomerizing)